MDLTKLNDVLVDLFIPILILISALILGKLLERLSQKLFEELELEKITKFPNERISVIVKYLAYLAGIIIALNRAEILLITFIILLIFLVIFLVILLVLELHYLLPNIVAGLIVKNRIILNKKIRISNIPGKIIKVTLKETILQSNKEILYVPNKLIWNSL